jgi:hypothetical protein
MVADVMTIIEVVHEFSGKLLRLLRERIFTSSSSPSSRAHLHVFFFFFFCCVGA